MTRFASDILLPFHGNFLCEFTENCFAIFDQSSCIILFTVLMTLFFPVNSTWLSLEWICQRFFIKPQGGEYNSISLHFGKLRQYVFFFISKLRCQSFRKTFCQLGFSSGYLVIIGISSHFFKFIFKTSQYHQTKALNERISEQPHLALKH